MDSLRAITAALALLSGGCQQKVPTAPRLAQNCDDVRKIMIAEQKAKIASKRKEQCAEVGNKNLISDPKSCFWRQYNRQHQARMAEHPDPDQRRLDDLEGKPITSKLAKQQSVHDATCRRQIEVDLNLTNLARSVARSND